jgi:hypothetical protein
MSFPYRKTIHNHSVFGTPEPEERPTIKLTRWRLKKTRDEDFWIEDVTLTCFYSIKKSQILVSVFESKIPFSAKTGEPFKSAKLDSDMYCYTIEVPPKIRKGKR